PIHCGYTAYALSRQRALCSIVTFCLPLTFFFFNDTAPSEIYTLSLHDALPISTDSRLVGGKRLRVSFSKEGMPLTWPCSMAPELDRKSTRLNSSHVAISYAVFCLKKKKIHTCADTASSR